MAWTSDIVASPELCRTTADSPCVASRAKQQRLEAKVQNLVSTVENLTLAAGIRRTRSVRRHFAGVSRRRERRGGGGCNSSCVRGRYDSSVVAAVVDINAAVDVVCTLFIQTPYLVDVICTSA